MRIVGGKHRGRPLKVPKGRDVRPTSDRARESIFNILDNGIGGIDLDGAIVLDVYAGSGAMALEALSRGAAFATMIDNSPPALATAKNNIATLGEWRNVRQLKLDASHLAPPPRVVKAPVTIAFIDPPYEQELLLPTLLGLNNKGWITEGTLLVIELGSKEEFEIPPKYKTLDDRKYGAARVLFLVRG